MLRSIQKCFEIIKKQDPETNVTVHSIRVWCKENKVKNLRAGNKILIDLDSLLNFINFKGETEWQQ